MLTHFDTIDSLPYIDYGITPQERRRVDELVQQEVAQLNTDDMHPAVGPMLPLSSNMERFRRRPQAAEPTSGYERDDEDNIAPQSSLPQGIDMSRYTDFHDEEDNDADSDNAENINHERMYTSLAYSMLRERNASLALQNDESVNSIRNTHLDSLSKTESSYQNELERKRQRVEEINEARKKRQIDFQPVNEYLEEKWHDGINSMIDMGIHKRSGN
ncbi:hypothetical protein CXQ85_000078 [Candidozyma haemuli]|uniref:Pre-mRNA-splicing factor SPF27 n=1 Tax=Candidozyma haemuli TaxID=45357 RepID=A0A2V1AUW7_9ASCO|nr:hypothetical protein CXQ85_000078 [[Candida] haemuloni]PVH21113.1 hypothetical protein CXQ85_000078 [[Candida] haemuloni]